MYGTPGLALLEASNLAGDVDAGHLGEVNFAKTLARCGFLDRFATFWSLHKPDFAGEPDAQGTDIDCVIITAGEIVLVDVKHWTQGDVHWAGDGDRLVCVDRHTGARLDERKPLTKQMSAAQQTMTRLVERVGLTLPVFSFVVFMPTDHGLGDVSCIDAPKAKGGHSVRVLGLPDLLDTLSGAGSYAGDLDTQPLLDALRALLKT